MINRQTGIVTEVICVSDVLSEIKVLINGLEAKAYAFPQQTGEIKKGDCVILNTTAVDLGLGSGGYHFVMSCNGHKTSSDVRNQNSSFNIKRQDGHIMKLRYTPFQLRVCAVEESENLNHDTMDGTTDIKDIPVICGSLHSALIPCVCGVKAINSNLRIAYVMTDGGALPLALSKATRILKEHKLIAGTVTVGHAYGGDCEAINLYSGLLAAVGVLRAQVIIVLMGPGVVGTATKWGNTAIEVGQIINATAALNGRSYTIARLSFADRRNRHYGLSHHTRTALEDVALSPTQLVLPKLERWKKQTVQNQLNAMILKKHRVIWGDGYWGIKIAEEAGFELNYMGRKYVDDPAYFLAASAAGEVAASTVVITSSKQNDDTQ